MDLSEEAAKVASSLGGAQGLKESTWLCSSHWGRPIRADHYISTVTFRISSIYLSISGKESKRPKEMFSSSKWAPPQERSKLLPAISSQLMTEGAGSCYSRIDTGPRTGWKWKKRVIFTALPGERWLDEACVSIFNTTIRYLPAMVTSTQPAIKCIFP